MPRQSRANSLAVAAAVVAAALLSFLAAFLVWRMEAGVLEQRERARAQELSSRVSALLRETEASLRAGAAIIGEDGKPDASSMRQYSAGVLGRRGVFTVGVFQRVGAAERKAFERTLGGPIREDVGSLRVAARRSTYFPLVFVRPRSAAAQALIGWDVWSDPVRRPTLEQAVRSGAPTFTTPLTVAATGRRGLIAYMPLKARAGVVALIATSIDAEGLLQEARVARDEDVRIAESGYGLAGAQRPLQDASSVAIVAGGRRWVVQVHSHRDAALAAPLAVGSAGLLLSLVLGLLFAASHRRERSLDVARANAAALHRAATALANTTTTEENAEIVAATITAETAASGSVFAWAPAGEPPHIRCSGDFEGHEALVHDAHVFLAEIEQPIVASSPDALDIAVWAQLPPGGFLSLSPVARTSSMRGWLLARWPTEPERSALSVVETLAVQAGMALQRVQSTKAEHELAVSLQRSLLPTSLAVQEGVSIGVSYTPATFNLGGDWYDAIALDDGRLAVAVGDVVGHDASAAAVMGQLRSGFRAILQASSSAPSALLTEMSRFAATIEGAECTTVAYALIDLEAGTATLASAGHPPALLIEEGGNARYLDTPPGPPLAVDVRLYDDNTRLYDAHTVALATGSTLLLFTDGAFEQRGMGWDTAMEVFAEQAREIAASAASAQDLADRLAARMRAQGQRNDDIAIVAVTLTRRPLRTYAFNLGPHLDALAEMRHSLAAWLQASNVPEEIVRETVLATHEAAANALEHSNSHAGAQRRPASVTATIDDGDRPTLTVTVADHGTWLNTPSGEDRGRGLDIIRALAEDVAIDRQISGTTVSFTRTIGPAGDPRPDDPRLNAVV